MTQTKSFQVYGLSAASSLYFVAEHLSSGLVILPSSMDVLRAKETLQFFVNTRAKVLAYPAFERLFEPLRQDPAIVFERLNTQHRLCSKADKNVLIVTNFEALTQKTVSPQELLKHIFVLNKKDWIERDSLIIRLYSLGYKREDLAQDEGFFSVRGHLVDVYTPYHPNPFRLEFFGDELISIRSFDPLSQRSLEEMESIQILPTRELFSTPEKWPKAKERIKNLGDEKGLSLVDRERLIFDLENQREVLEPRWLLPLFSPELVDLSDYLSPQIPRIYIDRPEALRLFQKSREDDAEAFHSLQRLCAPISELHGPIDIWTASEAPQHQLSSQIVGKGLGYEVQSFENLREQLVTAKGFGPLERILAQNSDAGIPTTLVVQSEKRRQALYESLGDRGRNIEWTPGPLFDGFSSTTFRRAFITERDIFGVKRKAARMGTKTKEDFLQQFSDLKDGDYVIHEDHGIARFRGLQKLPVQSGSTEFLSLEFADNDKLYLPVYRLDKLSRYVSEGYGEPRLDRLGTQHFQKKKARIREDILKIAHELLAIAAARKSTQVTREPLMDERAYQEFAEDFAFEPTPDQEAAILEIEKDLSSSTPMDRLVCGDVGFGKTEVAMRAAMLTLLRGKQVAVLAPTTILVEQHFRNFKKRFHRHDFRIEHVSRFVSASEQKRIAEGLSAGAVNLIIGTHRLLGSDLKFKDLGLLIVDEEQRFGVKHKEKLKKLRTEVDILTLSATPIPRTLQLSVNGIRELSLIVTPPDNREAVRTHVATFDEGLIKSVIQKELDRGGQVLFVHNRVQTIDAMAQKLQAWMPHIKATVAHGQMSETELEEKMLEFLEGRSQLLLSTSIIENGLDIPTANTLLVDHAEMFGLSNLYQLRGRVGRSHLTASAYFLIHETTELTKEASKRLQVIQSCTELGSGFNVATHDLEIRGSGNILGEEQSGVIAEIGLELYTQMLQETLAELKNEEPQDPLPELSSGYTAYIPETYIPDPALRISIYKLFDRVRTPAELLDLEEELLDRFGLYPPEVENFCRLIGLRTLATALHAASLDIYPGRLAILLTTKTPLDPLKIIPLLGKNVSLDPKGRVSLSYEAGPKDFETCRKFLSRLCELAGVQIVRA